MRKIRRLLKICITQLQFGNTLMRRYLPNRMYVAILSYPKCGRTWLRLMLGKVIQLRFGLENMDLMELEAVYGLCPRIPRISISHDSDSHFKRSDELPTYRKEYKGHYVIFLVRDPRDVLVSHYLDRTRRFREHWGDISSSIRDERLGIDTLIRYYNIWYKNKEVPADFLLVRYEDMREDPEGQLKKVINFLGIDGVDHNMIREAVEFANFDNMLRMEKKGTLASPRLTPGDPEDRESYKVRRGKVGGYVDYLTAEDITYLNNKIRMNLADYFGYR